MFEDKASAVRFIAKLVTAVEGLGALAGGIFLMTKEMIVPGLIVAAGGLFAAWITYTLLSAFAEVVEGVQSIQYDVRSNRKNEQEKGESGSKLKYLTATPREDSGSAPKVDNSRYMSRPVQRPTDDN